MVFTIMFKKLKSALALVMISGAVTVTPAQVGLPPAASPDNVAAQVTPSLPVDPSAVNPVGAASLEPVRQAIARQDYPAAQTALDSAKRANPNSPGIAMYQSLIQRGQAEGIVQPAPSPAIATPPAPALMTPALDVTPADSTAKGTGNVATSPSGGTVVDKAKELWANEMVRYGIIGAGLLLLIAVIFIVLKKRRARASYYSSESPTPTGMMSIGIANDHWDNNDQGGGFGAYDPSDGLSGGGLSSSSPSMDYSAPGDFSGAASGASNAGGFALAGGMEGYSVPTFDNYEEEEEATPPPRPAPVQPVDDDAMISIFADDEPAPAAAVAPVAPVSSPDFKPFESSEATSNPTSKTGFSHFTDEETVILSAPDAEPLRPTAGHNTTPTSNLSVSPGTVDLEDIFGSQALPGQSLTSSEASQDTSFKSSSPDTHLANDFHSATDLDSGNDDPNSFTLPTFVSAPDKGNPGDKDVEPPSGNQRQKADPGSDTQSISFEELFGSPDDSSASGLTPSPTHETPVPTPVQSDSDLSVEDALAAALSAMAAEAHDEAPADSGTTADAPALSSESLDDRTERMFNDQMEKARRAVNEKNWRQAVHVLSIASALHPENDEAKQLLKNARAEKRKSEESV